MLRWRPGSVVLVSLFVLLDLAIVVSAFALSRRGADPSSVGSSVSSAGATSTPTDSEEAPLAGPLALAASPTGAVARVTRGSCDTRDPERARVWVSAKAGGALTARSVPGLVESLGVDYGRRSVTIVGTDSACRVHGYVSTDGGATWKQGAVPRDVWWLDPDTTSETVHGPTAGGDVDLECTPVSVATGSEGAVVACGDGGLVRLDQQGRPSRSQPLAANVVAAAPDGSGRTLVLGATSSCGARLQLVRTGSSPRPLTCLGNDVAPLGLAIGGSRWFVQVGYRLAVSQDGGDRFTDYPNDPVTAAGG